MEPLSYFYTCSINREKTAHNVFRICKKKQSLIMLICTNNVFETPKQPVLLHFLAEAAGIPVEDATPYVSVKYFETHRE